jgi:hypothetical protein
LFSVLVALLLATSSLAQVAHFLLVPHAFCAEHGELLELGPGHPAAAQATSTPAHEAQLSSVDAEAGHDHCELLGRSQREQLLPARAAFDLPAPRASFEALALPATTTSSPSLACLTLAPKTSPPRA